MVVSELEGFSAFYGPVVYKKRTLVITGVCHEIRWAGRLG
jgi:hypothetical protein